MDITQAVECCSEIIETLRNFPRSPRLPPCDAVYVSQACANETRQRDLERCIPLLTTLALSIQEQLSKYDSGYFESIDNRQAYINSKQEECRKENEQNSERIKLLEEIERYERNASHKIRSVQLTRAETLDVARMLHQPGRAFKNHHLEPVLRKWVLLDAPEIMAPELGVYRRIIEIFGSKVGHA